MEYLDIRGSGYLPAGRSGKKIQEVKVMRRLLVLFVAVFLFSVVVSSMFVAVAAVRKVEPSAAPKGIIKLGQKYVETDKWEFPYVGRGNLALDSGGSTYVAGWAFGKGIRKFSSAGVPDASWGIDGVAGGQLKSVIGIGVDASKNVYIAETENWEKGAIKKINSKGGLASNWEQILYNGPTSLKVSPSGKVYAIFAHPSEKTWLYIFDSNGKTITKKEVTKSWGKGILAVDSAENFYLREDSDKITKLDPSGAKVLAEYNVGLDDVMRAAVDSAQNVYVLGETMDPKPKEERFIVRVFMPNGEIKTQFQIKLFAPAQTPGDIAVDSSGSNIYVYGQGGFGEESKGFIIKYSKK